MGSPRETLVVDEPQVKETAVPPKAPVCPVTVELAEDEILSLMDTWTDRHKLFEGVVMHSLHPRALGVAFDFGDHCG